MLLASDVLTVFRRRIGDTESPYTFEDVTLYGYISDAIAQIEVDWARGISFSITEEDIGEGNIVTRYDIVTDYDLQSVDTQLFAVKSHYLITLTTKSKADRDNFRMVKGRLTLDNTNQAKDHAETLRILDSEYKRTLLVIKNGGLGIKGIRVE